MFPGNEGSVEKKVKGDLANFLLVDLSSGNGQLVALGPVAMCGTCDSCH